MNKKNILFVFQNGPETDLFEPGFIAGNAM